jgi:hypothetical protein
MKLGGKTFSHWGRYSAQKTQSENDCKYFNSVLRTLTKFVLFSNQNIFTLMTWFLFVFINQTKYYAQDTGNQYSILGRLICLPDCDKTSEKRKRKYRDIFIFNFKTIIRVFRFVNCFPFLISNELTKYQAK